ncbi:uncharacterized protein [Palaemon carinicauda]|uniref:uncharacterized protein isoform X1 n=1 Tax=Palaemon carinicauda TaxID=392227 RepID=UPI0035B5EFB4
MNRWSEGLCESAPDSQGLPPASPSSSSPSSAKSPCLQLQGCEDNGGMPEDMPVGVPFPVYSSSLPAPPDPDRENTDDSGMGADLEGDDRPDGTKDEEGEEDDDDDDEEEEEEEVEDEEEEEHQQRARPRKHQQEGEAKMRRTSSAGNERQRRPSYTCYHGPILSRNTARMGRRARPRPPRDLDVLQLAAGAACMLAPVTPDLLR